MTRKDGHHMELLQATREAKVIGVTTDAAIELCWVGLPEEELPATSTLTFKNGRTARLVTVPAEKFGAYLDGLGDRSLAVAFFSAPVGEVVPDAVRVLRARSQHERTRVYLVASESRALPADGGGETDIEEVIGRDRMSGSSLTQIAERGVRAFNALGTNPLLPRFYLDATFNGIFDWFETTRWDWSELGNFSKVDKKLLREEEIETLKESAVIEFGTLPGAHNFLREWHDEFSFSSWALSWGAEEARHSLIQCRYLQHIGVDIPAKHAMYKREPYPMGKNRAATLMMNIISEARAAAYYKRLANESQEPTLRRIWKLLGRDEARHARAFFVFCKEECDRDPKSRKAMLEMAYVWLADRADGIKHPAGHFYPHSTSARGIKETERSHEGMTDQADENVLAMIRNILDDESVKSVRDVKARLRELA
ncbi:MAG: ferritin-like domain-containing protein [Deltaproteobacteria bacterium]|nr:ferritin-like domain-containing protein [Deltaproteobacteria bacterium]